ncbi:MAG: hypothetical protein KY475_11030, partial [Planctomycetes bacterium]|nr:hypothetical protein [Planctomycetota bacterium]
PSPNWAAKRMRRTWRKPAPVKEYDLFIPLTYNDGSPIEPRKLQDLLHRLLEQFGGVTLFPQPNEGYWTMGDVTYRDEIVIFRVLASKPRVARRFLSRLKQELKIDLKQEELLIVERDVDTI